jgi:hypothetical protein
MASPIPYLQLPLRFINSTLIKCSYYGPQSGGQAGPRSKLTMMPFYFGHMAGAQKC